jgi:tetratricopeptide (TPR) repeat protein
VTPSSDGDVKPVRLGPYRLDELLGFGGMGRVWRGWDERLRRRVALKELRADAMVSNVRERLRREAQAAARLNHPSIVHIYDIVEQPDGDWIVMELVEGKTLSRRVRDEGALSVSEAVRIGREIAEGLAEAHAHDILHRDLKSVNVMVTPAGRAKILDFGLAKELAREGRLDPAFEATLSVAGALLGTSHAMSPEQVMGRPLDARSDLFSLGSLLYEILSGKPPFLGETSTASLALVLTLRPPALREMRPDVPKELSDLVARLLEKEPGRRPQSAREVAEALAGSIASMGGMTVSRQAGPDISLGFISADLNLPTLDQSPSAASRVTGATLGRRRAMGERRLVSVVCCGLVGLDEASGEVGFLDVETLSEAMPPVQDLARGACERLDGRLAAAMGHVLWLHFGYPEAHEDDAERAVRAARELVARTGELGLRSGPRRLAARAAVHTGPAVITAHPGQEDQAQLGATLDLATGLQGAAPAQSVVVSAESQRLVARSFATEPLAPVRLSGFDEPVPLFRVAGEVDARSAEQSGAVTPLVGRERELELLLDRFRLASSGTGQVVMVGGEAGIGKSRLLLALRQRLADEARLWMVAAGTPYTRSSPLAPIVELLGRTVSSEPGDGPLERLEELVRRHGLRPEDQVPLLAPLLSLPTEGRYPPLVLGPEVRRSRTLEAVVGLLAQMAERRPLVLAVEDLHWIDPSTLDLLGLLLGEISGVPLLLVMTFRPGFQAPWGHRANVTQLSLTHLSGEETETLIQRLTVTSSLPPDALRQIVAQIVAKTDGVPLFVEELTRAVLETGWTSGGPELPSTLSASLNARLDRLGPAREIAQLASVIGRTFSLDLLAAVSALERSELQPALDELLRAELVYRRGAAPRVRYFFKHALVQDAAYASLLARDRQALHLKVALALESEGAQPEVVGRHYTAARDFDRAWDCWLLAGQTALSRFALAEAAEHLRQSLAALESLPASPERDQREIASQSLLGVVLSLLRGHAAVEVEAAYGRVLELGDRTGSIPQELYPGLWAFYNARADLSRALQLAGQMLQNAEAGGEPGPLSLALCASGTTRAFLGDLEGAREAFERSLALHPPDQEARESSLGFDPRVLALGQLGQISWVTGLPDTALRQCQQALDLAESLGDPVSTALAVLLFGHLALTRRDFDAALEHARKLNALSREHAFHSWTALSELALGCAEAELAASREEALPALERAAAAFQTFRSTHGHNLDIGRNAAWLIEAGLRHGWIAEGEELLARTLEIVERTGERFWEPELLRLRGVLARARGEEGEPFFREALAAARRMGAVSLERRAADELSG